MEQHPIPQQISSYQFKLVGDMTLKQFFQVAGGAVVGLLFYSTGLNGLIKWPLILISVGLGAAMAFLPFEERPLEKWIIAFFRSIYSPTLFTWKKTEKAPVFFTETTPAPEIVNVGSLNQNKTASPLEEAEKSFLSKIGGLFTANNLQPTAKQAPPQTTAPIPTTSDQKTENTVVADTKPTAVDHQPATNVSVPQQIPTIITKSAPRLVVEETSPKANNQTPITNEIQTQKLEEKVITADQAEFSVDAAPPYPPTVPNTIVGQVMDADRKIIEGAIMEIKDTNGRPVRALKTNKAGHFIIVTPLANGKYEVITEKEGFTFKPISFEAKGEIIKPIAIRAE